MRDPQKLSGHVVALRKALETAKKRGLDASEVELFRTAWTWELTAYGPNRVEEFRRVVRADVEFLREHLNYDSGPWISMCSFGYKQILGDDATVKAIEDETLLRAPNGEASWWIAQDRWRVFLVDPQGRRLQRRPTGDQTIDSIEEMADQLAK